VHIGRSIKIGSREAEWLAVTRGMGIGVVSAFKFTSHPGLWLLHVADAERRSAPLIAAFLDVVDALLSRPTRRQRR